MTGKIGSLYSVCFTSDSRRVFCLGTLAAMLRDVGTGDTLATFPLKGLVRYRRTACSPDGRYLATHDPKDRSLSVWEIAGPRKLLTLAGQPGQPQCVTFSADGTRLACGDDRGTVVLWEVATGRLLETFTAPASDVSAVALSADGRRLAAAGTRGDADMPVRVWDLETRQEIATFDGHTGMVSALAFCHGLLASGSADRTVRLWDMAELRPAGILRGHTAAVTCVAFSPDGRRLASGSRDTFRRIGAVRLWDVARAEEVLPLPGVAGVADVAFSPDGRRLAAADLVDPAVVIWDGTPLPVP